MPPNQSQHSCSNVPVDVLTDAANYLQGLARSGATNTAAALEILADSPPAKVASTWLDGHRGIASIDDFAFNFGVDRLSVLQTVNLLAGAGQDLAIAASLIEQDVQERLRPGLETAATLEATRADPEALSLISDGLCCARWALGSVQRIRERFRTDFGILVRGSWPDYLVRAAEKAFEIRADVDAEMILEMAGTPPSLLPYLAKVLWRGNGHYTGFDHALALAALRRSDDARADEFKLGRHQVLSLDDDAAAPLFEFEALFEQVDDRESQRAEKIIANLDPTELRFYELIAEGQSARSAARMLGLSSQVYERFRKRKSRRTLKSVPKTCFSTRN